MIYIVVPCYNEQEVLVETTRQLTALCSEMAEKGEDVRILYADDGSSDRTWQMILELHESHPQVSGIRLAHNVGHQQALWAGMEVVAEEAEAIVSIDADLQDDIRVIPRMIENFRQGADIVYGVRKERKTDTFFKRQTAQAFYTFMNKMGCDTVYNHADYRLLSKRALRALLSYPERNLFLRGMVPTLGFNTQTVYYDRLQRQAGESKYPLKKMMELAVDGVTSFSIKPMRMIYTVGMVFILCSIAVIIWAVVSYLQGKTIQGWTSLLVSVWFVGGTLLFALGIIGEYIGKIYAEVKRRPRYFVMERTE